MARPNLAVVETADRTPLERAVDDFLRSRRAKATQKTVAHYRMVTTRILLPWAVEQGLREVSDLDQHRLDDFSGSLQEDERGLSRSSVRSYMQVVASFLNWAREDGVEGASLAGKARKPKSPEISLPVLTAREMQRLEDQAANKPHGGLRDGLIVSILCQTGLRAGELCQLTLEDLQQEGRSDWFLRVARGKGDRGRRVPVSRELARRLQRYISKGRPRDAAPDRIFVSLQRHPRTGQYEPLTTSGVLQMVRSCAQEAGIRKRVYSHLLRHSFATNYLRTGGSTVALRRILGHSSLQMIDTHYVNLVDDDLANSMREYQQKLVRQLADDDQ